jgi:hypothetical protein
LDLVSIDDLERAARERMASIAYQYIASTPPSFRLRAHQHRESLKSMTRQQVESAVARGVPFSLLMADGREYRIPHPDYISLPPKSSYVIVYDDEGHFTVLPLLTVTGLQSTVTDASSQAK